MVCFFIVFSVRTSYSVGVLRMGFFPILTICKKEIFVTEKPIKKPLVKKPIGSIWDSKHRWAREIKCSLEPSGPVTCELCGTSHPKLPEMPTEEGDYDID